MTHGYGYSWGHIVKHFDHNGGLVDTFDFGVSNAYWGSMAFDASNKLYIPTDGTNDELIHTISNSGAVGTFGGGYTLPTSVVVDNKGNVYVGENGMATHSPGSILKFDSKGSLLATYSIPEDPFSGDDIDDMALANDQCTMRYTSIGQSIHQINVCTGAPLPDFVAVLPDPTDASTGTNEQLNEIRQLPNGNVLVGSLSIAYLLNSSGGIIQQYEIRQDSSLSSVFPDPDKVTFWAGDWSDDTVYRINLQTGAIVTTINAWDHNTDVGGYTLAVVPNAVSQDGKELGKSCNCIGDPINAATGNEYKDDQDISLGALSLHRYYNSQTFVTQSHIGTNWRHTFDRSLQYVVSGGQATATAIRDDGRELKFTLNAGQWTSAPDVADRLTAQTDASGTVTGWTYFDASTRNQETYDQNGNLLSITDTDGLVTTLTYSDATTPSSVAPAAGLLLTVTDPRGRVLRFSYNSNATVAAIAQPAGGVVSYGYDGNANLTSVAYPDKTSRQYVYNESTLTGGANLPVALTGDIDETGTRFTSVAYDAQGRATLSMLASNVAETQVAYNNDGTTSVTYPTGSQSTLAFNQQFGSFHRTTVSAPCGVQCDQPYASATFDAQGYPASSTDFNGNLTQTSYDPSGLLNQQIEASGTSNQRTTQFNWNNTLRVPLTRTVLNATGHTASATQWVYNGMGQVLARCDIDPDHGAASGYACSATGSVPAGVRRTTYTYCTAVDTTHCPQAGLMLTATGTRTDIAQTTRYSYYMTSSAKDCRTPGAACHQAGDVHTITDAVGHVTTLASYDADGHVTRTIDTNGIPTDRTYTPRGWLASQSVNGATTRFTYTPYGAVQTVTDPDGVITTYGYDAAHRLVKLSDALGNSTQYTLDAAGNKIAEKVYDSAGTLHKTLSRTFNILGQMTSTVDGLKQTVFNANLQGSYDSNGNLVLSADALGIQHKLGYDGLNRLVQTIDNYNGKDSATANTQGVFDFDALDRIDGIGDPDGLNTVDTYDGLGNLTQHTSPDSGSTKNVYDAAGNLIHSTDARGITRSYTYDALDRMTSLATGRAREAVRYVYDDINLLTGCSAHSYPMGHLSRVLEATVSTTYCYDAQGRITEKRQTVGQQTDITRYSYTPAGRLSSIVQPSGTRVSYTRNRNGQISAVTVTPLRGAASTVASAITYLPFGPLAGYTLGNGETVARAYDANYRLTDLTSAALSLHYSRDANGNVIGLTEGGTGNTFSYDALGRLATVKDATGKLLESYTYSKAGDRLSKTGSGQDIGPYSYQSGTHRLTRIGNNARSYDKDGNTTGASVAGETWGYDYNGRGRMTVVQRNRFPVAAYTDNAFGERVAKVATMPQWEDKRYVYNEQSQLIAEQDTFGRTAQRDYIWLDDLPIAVVDNQRSRSRVDYVLADGLNTPRVIQNARGTTIWSWSPADNAFGERQAHNHGYTYNLRFPGQYYDEETGLHQNVNRDYDPAAGRYRQVDPMGHDGGQWSLYAYVDNDPLSHFDYVGLQTNLNLFPSGSSQWQGANNYPANPGIYTVAAHGNPLMIVDAQGNPILPQDLANMIKHDKNYKPGEPVVLLSCNTGVTPSKPWYPSSYAQFLANDLPDGSVVSAPNNFLWLNDEGQSVVAGARDANGRPVDWTGTSISAGGITMDPSNPGKMVPFYHQ
ncbi:RHS repeat-associated core domain-containing protein [Dyella choica]|nr:RHS repeat-associated core domain-containing protein [Dyella choica]